MRKITNKVLIIAGSAILLVNIVWMSTTYYNTSKFVSQRQEEINQMSEEFDKIRQDSTMDLEERVALTEQLVERYKDSAKTIR